MEANNCSKMFRRLISSIITIALLVLVFVLMVVIDGEQEKRLKNYPFISCGDLKPTKQEALDDYLLGIEKINLIECYCW